MNCSAAPASVPRSDLGAVITEQAQRIGVHEVVLYLGIDWSYRKRNEHPSNPGSTQPDQHPKGDLTTPTIKEKARAAFGNRGHRLASSVHTPRSMAFKKARSRHVGDSARPS